MTKKQIVNYIDIETILRGTEPLIVILFPNYEDRTCVVVDKILSLYNEPYSQREISFMMFCLKNKSNNNMLLEDLKERNINSIKRSVGDNVSINECWLEYPSNFSPNALKMPIQKKLEEKTSDILFDISTIPKSILFRLCEDIKEFIRGEIIGGIYFAYSLPEKYSDVAYAQDIGLLKGLFSGEALHFSSNQAIHTILFPSRTGHEGKLLCDSLDSISRNTDYSIYFPVHKDDFIASLDVMQANQSLIDRETYLNYYYCTLDDAIKSLDELFQKEYTKIKHIVELAKTTDEELAPQVYLVAPFGAKAFLPVAYFELLNLQSVSPEVITIEIANVKGFQYTSLYSLGIGDLTCFELNGGKIKDVLRENQDL
jgi:hypothetical protein